MRTGSLTSLAGEVGLNQKKFQTCLDSGKYRSRVQEDFEEGSRIGITGTPGNILLHNKTGKTVLRAGAYPLEAFKQEIDQML